MRGEIQIKATTIAQVLDVLLIAGADCNRRTRLGLTPLHLAVLGRHPAAIETLCRDGGADPAVGCARTVEIGDSDEDTPERPHVRAVQGDTPAHFAARKVPALTTPQRAVRISAALPVAHSMAAHATRCALPNRTLTLKSRFLSRTKSVPPNRAHGSLIMPTGPRV
jgi:hypothetical protein